MAKTLEDLIQRVQSIPEVITKELPGIVFVWAGDALAIVWNKIEKEGIPGNYRYSEKEMLATQDIFLQKSKFQPDVIGTELGRDDNGKLIKSGKRTKKGNINRKSTKQRWRWIKFKNAKKAVPVMTLHNGYRELREIQGLQVSHIDLEYTGRLHQNIKVLNVDKENALKVLAIVGASDMENKKKMMGLHDRFGDFLAVPDDASQELSEMAREKVKLIIESILK